MAEPSLSSPDPTTSIPYPQYSFDLPLSECADIYSVADRFAPTQPAAYFLQIEFRPGGRRWILREQNVNGWLDIHGVAGPDSGLLTLPHFILDTIMSVFAGHASVGVHVDHDLNLVTVRDDEVEVVIDLPVQRPTVIDTSFEVQSHLVIKASDLFKIGSVLLTFPVALPEADDLQAPLPFLQFSFDGTTLRVRRDWTHFDGPALSVAAPASGDFRGEFSAFPLVLVRESCVNHGDEDSIVSMSFSEESPNLMLMTTPDLTMRVELGHEQVYWYRGALVSAFEEDGLEVIEDDRIGWDPTVRVVFDDAVVDATITAADEGTGSHIRLSCLVVKDSPWTLDIAAEINAWNNQWGNVKLVRQGEDIVAVSDLPVQMIPGAAAVARDLEAKSIVVREVIGVFL